MLRILMAAVLSATVVSALSAPVAAQNKDYFIPGQPKAQPAQRPAQRPTSRPAPAPAPAPVGVPGDIGGAEPPPQLNVELPPPPELPSLPKGEAPPVAVIGVIGVPEVMRASAAAQQVEKVIGDRRNKLNEDAQKEQAAWREMQQSLANDRPKLSADQVRKRERDLQERITKAQRDFRERNRIIQEAAQYSLAQIERTLISVIRQVADSRGMNLVLHRQQVALNVNQFDITDEVAEQLNKIQPSVTIPPDGVSPATMVQQQQKGAKAQGPRAQGAPVKPAPAK